MAGTTVPPGTRTAAPPPPPGRATPSGAVPPGRHPGTGSVGLVAEAVRTAGLGTPTAVRRPPRRWTRWLALAVGYGALSVAMWWHVWSGHPSTTVTCLCGDPGQSVWFVAWVAHALATLQNPLLSHAAAHPGGVNLLANQSSLLVGAALAPVTWLFGPVAALNVGLTLAAPLDALAAAALCRRFTGWGPAAAGGLLFGFSPLVVSELAYAHLADTVLVFVPLIALCLHELLVRRQRPPVRWGVGLAAAVVAQYFVSEEVLAITAVLTVVLVVGVGAVALVGRAVGALAAAGRRWRRGTVPWSATAAGLAVAVVLAGGALAWPTWFALDGPRHFSGAVWAGTADFGSPWTTFFRVPAVTVASTNFTHLGGYLGSVPPPGAYLGPGLLAVLAVGLVVARRRPAVWVAATGLVLAGVLSLGSLLLPFDWYSVWWLPWDLVGHLPVLQSIVPERVMVVGDLAAAVGLAVTLDAVAGRRAGPAGAPRWTDVTAERGGTAGSGGSRGTPGARPGGRRWAGPAGALVLAVAALAFPAATYRLPFATTSARLPAWFRRVAPTLPAGSVLLTLPFPAGRIANAMAWQAVDGFAFDLAGAYAKLPGPTGQVDYGGRPGSGGWALAQLTEPTGPLPQPTPAIAAAIRRDLWQWGVTAVVATGRQVSSLYPAQYAAGFMTAVLGDAPEARDGAWVWPIPADEGLPLSIGPTTLGDCVELTAGRHHLAPDDVPDCVLAAAAG